MKKISLPVSATAIFAPLIASAQGVCKLNGQVVPCSSFGSAFAGFFWIIIILWFLMVVFGIACLVFWIAMIVHAATKDIQNKAVWIIVVCLTGIIGAIIYYFAVKRPYDKAQKTAPASPATPPYTPPVASPPIA